MDSPTFLSSSSSSSTPSYANLQDDFDGSSGDEGSDFFSAEWNFSHVLAVFGFLAVNLIPLAIGFSCLVKHARNCLPSFFNLYFVGAVLMMSAFCLTTYALLSVDYSDRAVLRDYVTSLAVTEFFLAFACFFGICKHNYGGGDGGGSGSGNSHGRELPLPSYEEALECERKRSSMDKEDPESPREEAPDSVSVSSQRSASQLSSSSTFSTEEELPSFERAVYM